MSFDIFVIKFKNKEALRFKRASFEDIFGHHAIKREQGFMRIVYPDKGVQTFMFKMGRRSAV
jgi:hypothetical protein